MNEQQIPNLEEMDEREATRLLTGLASDLSPEGEYEIRHEDYAMEMPQSGERIRGRENMRAFQEAFPDHSDPPSIQIRRVLVRDGLWVVEGVIDYGGAGLPRRGHPRAQGRQDMARHPLLRGAVRGARVAGAVGRADGRQLSGSPFPMNRDQR